MISETRLRFYVNDTVIYQFYFGDFEIRGKYHSPFRNDPGPSLSFKNMGTFSNPKIVWKDFGLETNNSKDGIGFVAELYNLSRKEATAKIWKEMVMGEGVVLKAKKTNQPLDLPYIPEHEELQEFELKYWKQLFFDKTFLKFFDVYSLKAMRRVGKIIWNTSKENPTYIYLFGIDGVFKAYRPLDPNKDKFRGQKNGEILEGYNQLPKNGDHLIITSSLKDTMVLRKLGYIATNPTSENSKRAIYKKIRELNARFLKIYILFDNDKAGIRSANSLHRDTGWKIINFPIAYSKDPSDNVMLTRNYLQLSEFFSKFGFFKYHI